MSETEDRERSAIVKDHLTARLLLLRNAVQRYIDDPGCNIPARKRALARLQLALERSAVDACECNGEGAFPYCRKCGVKR